MHHDYEYVIKITAALYVGVEYITIFCNVALGSPSVALLLSSAIRSQMTTIY